MATVVRVKNVCDVCGNKRRKVKRWRVAQDSDLVTVELCSEHGEYLEKMLKIGERTPSASPRAKVWTMEEIAAEQRRQKQRKHPPA